MLRETYLTGRLSTEHLQNDVFKRFARYGVRYLHRESENYFSKDDFIEFLVRETLRGFEKDVELGETLAELI